MKKCLRCETVMVEGLSVCTNEGFPLDVGKSVFRGNLGRIKCAVCPECGYVETYVEDTTKIKKIIEKKL